MPVGLEFPLLLVSPLVGTSEMNSPRYSSNGVTWTIDIDTFNGQLFDRLLLFPIVTDAYGSDLSAS